MQYFKTISALKCALITFLSIKVHFIIVIFSQWMYMMFIILFLHSYKVKYNPEWSSSLWASIEVKKDLNCSKLWLKALVNRVWMCPVPGCLYIPSPYRRCWETGLNDARCRCFLWSPPDLLTWQLGPTRGLLCLTRWVASASNTTVSDCRSSAVGTRKAINYSWMKYLNHMHVKCPLNVHTQLRLILERLFAH